VSTQSIVAVVGRPNVGKSTLVNRLIGRREAVVEDTPGVTRDRVYYDAEWNGRPFTVVDTGGWESDAEGLGAKVAMQAEIAISGADLVLFVVDAEVGSLDEDDAVVRILRRTKKPVLLVANKVDGLRDEADIHALWNLGLGEPMGVSALHGRGSGELLDRIIELLPEESQSDNGDLDRPRRVALVGRPNVGKSSLLNALAGSERVVVDSLAGTTRDPVDEIIELNGRQWVFIDTAGIRKRSHQAQGTEYYATLRTDAAIEKAEVAVVLLDASVPMTEQDLRILSTVERHGRALVLVFNKWDLVDEDRRAEIEREIDRELVQFPWAPRVNLAAKTGWHRDRLPGAISRALDGWDTRVPTAKLNSFFGQLISATPPPVRGGKQPKILFATQASTCPPRFVLFTTGFLEASYRRFIERKLRENFGFEGTPIEVSVRVRERGDK
jgi:GTP-binding protein